MTHFVWQQSPKVCSHRPLTLEIGEIDNYNFYHAAEYIYKVLQTLEMCKLIYKNPYSDVMEVLTNIQNLVNDIDLDNDELQISERHHVRVEFRDELLAVELFVGA